MAEGIMGTTKAAVAFLATPIGLALGVLVTVLASVKAAFDTNQDVMDTFNKGMAEVKASAGVATDINGEFGLTQFTYAIVDKTENLEKIKKAMISERFIKNIMGYRDNVNHKYNRKIIATFRKDFWKEFI